MVASPEAGVKHSFWNWGEGMTLTSSAGGRRNPGKLALPVLALGAMLLVSCSIDSSSEYTAFAPERTGQQNQPCGRDLSSETADSPAHVLCGWLDRFVIPGARVAGNPEGTEGASGQAKATARLAPATAEEIPSGDFRKEVGGTEWGRWMLEQGLQDTPGITAMAYRVWPAGSKRPFILGVVLPSEEFELAIPRAEPIRWGTWGDPRELSICGALRMCWYEMALQAQMAILEKCQATARACYKRKLLEEVPGMTEQKADGAAYASFPALDRERLRTLHRTGLPLLPDGASYAQPGLVGFVLMDDPRHFSENRVRQEEATQPFRTLEDLFTHSGGPGRTVGIGRGFAIVAQIYRPSDEKHVALRRHSTPLGYMKLLVEWKRLDAGQRCVVTRVGHFTSEMDAALRATMETETGVRNPSPEGGADGKRPTPLPPSPDPSGDHD